MGEGEDGEEDGGVALESGLRGRERRAKEEIRT